MKATLAWLATLRAGAGSLRFDVFSMAYTGLSTLSTGGRAAHACGADDRFFRRLPGFFWLKTAGRKKADHQNRWSAHRSPLPSFLIPWPRRGGRQRKHVITLLGHQAWRKRNRL